MATEFACSRTEVEHVVGVTDGVFVMLYHQHGVTEVTECGHSLDQLLIVPLVQADRWFIEHIKHSAEAGTDLCSQADALAFASGEGSGVAIEREVVQARRS